MSFIQLGGQHSTMEASRVGVLTLALFSVFVIVGVFVLAGDSGGWWPTVRACGGGISKGEGRGGVRVVLADLGDVAVGSA